MASNPFAPPVPTYDNDDDILMDYEDDEPTTTTTATAAAPSEAMAIDSLNPPAEASVSDELQPEKIYLHGVDNVCLPLSARTTSDPPPARSRSLTPIIAQHRRRHHLGQHPLLGMRTHENRMD